VVAFLYKQPWYKAFIIGRFYSHYVRNHGFDDFPGGGTLYRDVEALFQSEVV
jgi:hypothetical protein